MLLYVYLFDRILTLVKRKQTTIPKIESGLLPDADDQIQQALVLDS